MSAAATETSQQPKALMWRGLGALEALFSDLPDLPYPGYVGLNVGPSGEVNVHVYSDLDATADLAARLGLTRYTPESYQGQIHHIWTGTVAGATVRVVVLENVQDQP